MFDAAISGLLSGFIGSSDSRTKDYLLLQGITPLLTILSVYIYFCVNAGPNYMKHREPFLLKKLIIAYNLTNVVACVWLVNEMLQSGWLRDYNYRCQPLDPSDSLSALRMARATWVYFMLKLFDLFDTIFFVLRKKDSQVTHLHLYHHASMPVLSWIHAKFVPGGHSTFGMLVNSAVHVIMYTYYLLAALGPQFQKYLWWKKYLTTIQMIQFVIILAHLVQTMFYDCGFPKFLLILFSFNLLYFLSHFSLFYKREYCQKNAKTKPS